MPTYQYACTQCDHSFEQVQRFSDDSLTVCPTCDGRLRKIFNAVGVVFKGSGFYRTDNRPESKSSSDSSSGSGESTSTSDSTSGSTSSDSGSGSTTQTVAKPKTESKGEAKAGSRA